MTLQSLLGSKKESNGKPPQGSSIPEYLDSYGTGFAKHLRFKLKSRDVEWLMIKPEMAKEMLIYNTVEGMTNRPLSAATVTRYARLIKDGEWGKNGQGTCEPIIFSDALRLLSGQHRLNAIVAAGVPQRMLVIYGEPDENFAYIDQGRRRTAADIFAIHHVPNHIHAAAATRWLMAYEAGDNSGDNALGKTVSPSNQETYDAYLKYEELQESIKVSLKYANNRLPATAVAAAIHYLCAKKSRRAADEYFSKVSTGVGITSARDPAMKVRDYLARDNAENISRKNVACALVSGWNATRSGKYLKKPEIEKMAAIT